MSSKKFIIDMEDYNVMFNKKYTIDTLVSYCFDYGSNNNIDMQCDMICSMFRESNVLDFGILYETTHVELLLNEYNTLFKIHNIYEHIDNIIKNYNSIKYKSDYINGVFKTKMVILLNMYLDLKNPISNLVEHHSKFLNDPTILSLMKEGE